MPQIIEVPGMGQVEFPDGMRDEDIVSAIKRNQPASAAPLAAGLPAPAQVEAPSYPIAQSAAQGVARGALNLVAAPFDFAGAIGNLAVGGANLGLAGIDKASQYMGGSPVSARIPSFPATSDVASEMISSRLPAEATVDPEKLGWLPHTAYNAARMTTEALGGAGALARMAAKRAAAAGGVLTRPGHAPPVNAPPAQPPRALDPLIKPYEGGNIGRTVTGDVAAATGAGAAVTGVERSDTLQDSVLAKTGASLLGGIAGAGIPAAIRSPKSVLETLYSGLPDPNISRDPITGASTSRRTSARAAEIGQAAATDPAAAADRLRGRVAEARAAGAPPPTSGLGSDDIGMVAGERAARLKAQVPFAERDRQTLNYVQDQLTGLRDPTADQSKATTFAQDRPQQLRAERDAAALPLLRQAEAAGVQANAQPVADLIEQQLTTAKRDPVVNALKAARAKLNAVGSDDLDTSVAGLYESRKAVNDIIEGRSDTPTGQFAAKELSAVRNELDNAIAKVAPAFKDYLTTYKAKSAPINALENTPAFVKLAKGEDPRDLASRLLSGKKYGNKQQFNAITREVTNNPEAQRAWRAAVTDSMIDKVATTNTALSQGRQEGAISIAKMQRVFKDNEPELAQLHGPKGMQTLRRAHKFLEPFGNLAQRAVTGSETEGNKQLTQLLENSVLAYTGNAVTAGMIMHRMRRAASMAGLEKYTMDAKLKRVFERMYFEPELFDHLMTKPVAKDPPGWNKRLNRLLGLGEGARERNDEDRKPNARAR